MKKNSLNRRQALTAISATAATVLTVGHVPAQSIASTEPVTKAFITGEEHGFVPLVWEDLVNVNCAEDTWAWRDGVLTCTGKPKGVIRSKKEYVNFELVCQWRHHKHGGNSGLFVWARKDVIDVMHKTGSPKLPKGIEVQVLDLGYEETYSKKFGKPGDWFTCHGDVFPVGAKMTPFPPTAPEGSKSYPSRSFPSKNLSLGIGKWNHYYVRAINGEVRLWVNGEEVSGGTNCNPRSGYLCFESEGAPVDFRTIRIRELP
jgi:hypothetical protein